MKIVALLENDPGLKAGERYAGILGASPSKGARSPLLWNAAFQDFGKPERMVPMDVVPEKLDQVLEALAGDADFVGGAVTMPYKESIAAWLGSHRLTPQALKIGAVNCLYRNDAGELCGTNTDGEAALADIKASIPDLRGVDTLLIGPGGAGKAVAAFLADAGASLTIVSRSPEAAQDFCTGISAKSAAYADIRTLTPTCSLIVNCTPVGFANGVAGESPIAAADLDQVRPGSLVFDIIYDPQKTPLLTMAEKNGLEIKNGLAMNLLQAVLGFSKATRITDLDRISASMRKAAG
ncbi:shikimate dehydrogenase [Roseibium sp. HPY-6]|uniref:shikimate dehydrogenase family protein n=1 Tax=Roseibium sp. HPY-6 TaxID=3229852 RepID=UPI0033906338